MGSPWAEDNLADPKLLEDSLERRKACERLGLVGERFQEASLLSEENQRVSEQTIRVEG